MGLTALGWSRLAGFHSGLWGCSGFAMDHRIMAEFVGDFGRTRGFIFVVVRVGFGHPGFFFLLKLQRVLILKSRN